MLVAVMTCERINGAVYLGDTLASLDAAGAREHDRLIVSDGPPPECETWGWPMIIDPGPAGSTECMMRALRAAARRGGPLLLVEDDVRLCRNAVRAAARLEVPRELAFVSLFHATIRPPEPGRRGLARYDFEGPIYCFSQALLLPERTVRYLASRDYRELPIGQRRWEAGTLGNASDLVLGALLYRGGYRHYGIAWPNFAEHTGAQSAVEPNGADGADRLRNIRSRWYAGDEFDALTWRP